MAAPQRRVTVTHPRTRATRVARIPAPMLDTQADRNLDQVLLASLIAAQLRLSLLAGALVLGIVVGIPVLLLAVPALQEVTVARVPVGWLALAVGVFPAVIVTGWLYIRAAERYERRYRELVESR
jgi:putative solute:sodium symporter small subunit